MRKAEPIAWRIAALIGGRSDAGSTRLVIGPEMVLTVPAGYRDLVTLAAGLYEPEVTRLIEARLVPGMSFVDAGAYVGYYSIRASRLVGPSGHVYCFEPNPSAYALLTANLRDNHCSNAFAAQIAVSSAAGPKAFAADPAGAESYVETTASESSHVVATTSMDEFFASRSWPTIDAIKMDIEGSECEALRGMRGLSTRNPDLQLILEFNPRTIARASRTPSDLAETLWSLGFRRSFVVEQHLSRVRGSLVPDTTEVCNLLLDKRD